MFTQDLETQGLRLAILKFMGILFFKDHNIQIKTINMYLLNEISIMSIGNAMGILLR